MAENANPDVCSETCHKTEVPSDDEIKALNNMRDIKERVRELKRKLLDLSSRGEDNKQTDKINSELQTLKNEWDEWENKRKIAETERMILLGHIEEKE